ncbi:hypothetical protein [Agrobacterium rosae]|uniref:hypothetical protein n=1 Tax=Agrobacterium rosae TaxID=1972867 RepID=UPI003A80F1A3
MDAFEMAESTGPIDDQRRENIAVYTSAERDREFPTELWQMVHSGGCETKPSIEAILAEIGNLREAVHPLALFKKLPTNTLYHLSKYFALRGGGYPLQRMSLGGLCMIEEASAKIVRGALEGALLSSYGNMDNIDNRLAFTKMGLVRSQENKNGVTPSAGAASLFLEPISNVADRGARPLAIINRVRSRFHDQMHAQRHDWFDFYRHAFPDLAGTSPIVVRYDNGIIEAGEAELAAIEQFFDRPTTFAYKRFTGYTGQPNNLIDLVLSLFDPAVPSERPIVLNGIGSSSGIGALLFEKCAPTVPVTTKAA